MHLTRLAFSIERRPLKKEKKCEWWARCVEVSVRAKRWGLVLKQFKHRKPSPRPVSLHSWHQLVPYRNHDRSLDQEDSFSWRTGKRVKFKAYVQCGRINLKKHFTQKWKSFHNSHVFRNRTQKKMFMVPQPSLFFPYNETWMVTIAVKQDFELIT